LKLKDVYDVAFAVKRLKNPKIMKKLILSIAFAGTIMIGASACNSTKSVSGGADSTTTDTTATPVDTTAVPADTTRTTPPDTTVRPM
jgi:hypothetical protein